MRITRLAFIASSLLVLIFSVAPVLADDSSGSPTTTTSTNTSTETAAGATNSSSESESRGASNKTALGSQGQGSSGKLEAAHLQSCQNRQASINNILGHIVTRGTNQLTLFSTIAQRVETFATNKNLTVPNYSQLVTTLQTDKAQSEADLAAMKTNSTIDCSGSNPKGMVSLFKSDLQKEITDLKTYKTDVKNLIVATKTATGSASGSQTTTKPTTTSGSNNTTGGNQ